MTRQEKLAKIHEIKKYFGWTNKDIAREINSTEAYIKNSLAPASKKDIPKWVDAMIAVFENK